MIPPTSIDGTDITGATIDGQDVEEITFDGQTVFTSGPTINNFPVAYSNLVLWYPFDSATYGGSNADDVTAILGGSGDNTAYDGTVNNVTYQSSGGVTDINAGANSGAFDWNGVGDIAIDTSFSFPNEFTLSLWINISQTDGRDDVYFLEGFDQQGNRPIFYYSNQSDIRVIDGGNIIVNVSESLAFNQYIHIAYSYDAGSWEVYYDGVNVGSDSGTFSFENNPLFIGTGGGRGFAEFATIDDFRIYNTALSSSQISQIYNNSDV